MREGKTYRVQRRELARLVTKQAKTKPPFAMVWSQLRLSGRNFKRAFEGK